MLKRILKVAGGLFTVVFTASAAFLVAMRQKYPPVVDAVRRISRDQVNPQQMETAGQPGAYASVVKHIGRTSGNEYETPVQARATDDGFVVPLPYGTSPDWFKNVVAAGSALIVNEGATVKVDHPEVVGPEAATRFIEDKERQAHRIFGVDEYLQVHMVEDSEKVPEPV